MTPAVAYPGNEPRLVVRDPVAHAISEPLGDGGHVFRERVDGVTDGPATFVLERLRRVPVEERDVRRDPAAEQLVHEPVVEVEPGGVDAAATIRQHPRPRDREPE